MNSLPTAVVDASVAGKWFLTEREPFLAQALELLRRQLSGELVLAAPDHLRLELLHALRRRGFPGEALVRSAGTLDELHLEWYRIDGALGRAAAELSAEYQITPYDACYCALARALETQLITDDRQLAASGACSFRLLGELA